jgi:hypothetical protein
LCCAVVDAAAGPSLGLLPLLVLLLNIADAAVAVVLLLLLLLTVAVAAAGWCWCLGLLLPLADPLTTTAYGILLAQL